MTESRRAAADRVVVERLRQAGVQCQSVYDLVNGPTPPRAAPVLLQLLDVVEEPAILEGIVRALRTAAARRMAEKPLIALFERLRDGSYNSVKWAIGNTLGGLDRRSVAAELLRLATDRSHGAARQMIVEALAYLPGENITEALTSLLGDDDVVLHAIGALRRRRAREATPALIALALHSNPVVRHRSASAVAAISKRSAALH